MMQDMGSFIGGFGYLSISLGFIKIVLEIMLYISLITLSFKAVKALNIYIDRSLK